MRTLPLYAFVAALTLAWLAGCATYIPPGAKADLQAFAPANIQEGFDAKPTSPFPASIAAVRVKHQPTRTTTCSGTAAPTVLAATQ